MVQPVNKFKKAITFSHGKYGCFILFVINWAGPGLMGNQYGYDHKQWFGVPLF